MTRICGFTVVNKTKPGKYHGDCGFDESRRPWDVLDTDFYAKALPDELLPILNEYNNAGPYELVFSTDFARQAAEYSRSRGYDVEIIGVYSKEWEIKTNAFECDEKLEFLGYDPVGGWSILQSTIFGHQLYPEWKTKLNQYGLFKNRMDAHCFTEFYMKNSEPDGWLEQPGDEVCILEVYRLVED